MTNDVATELDDKLKFVPLFSEHLAPEKRYVHRMHYSWMTLQEAYDSGLLQKVSKCPGMIGFDIETNGLTPDLETFKVSGFSVAVRGHHDFGGHGVQAIDTHDLQEGDDLREYTSIWIEMRDHSGSFEPMLEWFRAMDAKAKLMAHNSAYEFKVWDKVFDCQLWNLQDSMAYLIASGFDRLGLKMNAKTLVNAHEWEAEVTTWRKEKEKPTPLLDEEGNQVKDGRKKVFTPGWTSEQSWGAVPTKLLGPYCAWDTVWTLSMTKEIIRRDKMLCDLPNEMYPGDTPVMLTQEPYRRQIILSGILDVNGAPTTKKAIDSFITWGIRSVVQSKLYLAKELGKVDIPPLLAPFQTESLAVDNDLPWPATAEEHLELWTAANEFMYLEGNNDEDNYEVWDRLFLDKLDGRRMLKDGLDVASKDLKLKVSPLSAWRQWAGLSDDFVFGFKRGAVEASFKESGQSLLDPDCPHAFHTLARIRWARSVHKQVNDLLNYTKREKNSDGQVTNIVDNGGLLSTETGAFEFGWRACVMATRRWGSGFHIVSPRSAIQDIYDTGEGRLQIHADLSGAEIQSAMAQAKERPSLESFCAGTDFHKENASAGFGVPIDQVDKRMRDTGKVILFRLLFGSSVVGMANFLDKSVEYTQSYLDNFFSSRKNLKKWLDKCLDEASSHLFRVSVFGDRLKIPAHQVSTTASNVTIQHCSSNLVGVGLYNLARKLKMKGLDAYLFGFIHDSTDVSSSIPYTFKVIEEMYETMAIGQLEQYGIPARLDFELGALGASCLHLGNFSGTGHKDSPWTFSTSGYVEQFEMLKSKLEEAFDVTVEIVKETDEPADLDALMTYTHEGVSYYRERPAKTVEVVVHCSTDDTSLHTADLKKISDPLPAEKIRFLDVFTEHCNDFS